MRKPFATVLEPESSLANHTGAWRTERPVYVHALPVCNNICQSGEDVQGWLYHAAAGTYREAWRALVRDNPLPATMGRVCYHPCETACNRRLLDQPVNIHAVERYVGDEAIRHGWTFDEPAFHTGKRVLIVGAGPAGLSAAYQLRCMGHSVTVFEAGSAAGGMMRFAIPRFRLPRHVLEAEIARIAALGVEFVFDTRVDDLSKVMLEGHFDAAFLGAGAERARRTYVPACDGARILDALSVLRDASAENPPQLGRKVLVYGGGNTAMDVARTALRLGADESLVVYRRTRDKMPAHESEVQDALDEGIKMRWLSVVSRAEEHSFLVEKTRLDEKGAAKPTGEFEAIEADCLVLALGQDVDMGFLDTVDGLQIDNGLVRVNEHMMTDHPGVFAGGDMVATNRTVTAAIGHGKKAARNIDSYLRGAVYAPGPKHVLATFEKLNPWYYAQTPEHFQPVLDPERRETTFDEVLGDLTGEHALLESRRCLSCGNCFECDNCYGLCPDNAVSKIRSRTPIYEFKYDYCKGCGICAAECPCGAIQMIPEPLHGAAAIPPE
jgi:NADPH-dependent glutamate synthase beta subunit-like oxidoreductase